MYTQFHQFPFKGCLLSVSDSFLPALLLNPDIGGIMFTETMWHYNPED
jgi:hypothetical protein